MSSDEQIGEKLEMADEDDLGGELMLVDEIDEAEVELMMKQEPGDVSNDAIAAAAAADAATTGSDDDCVVVEEEDESKFFTPAHFQREKEAKERADAFFHPDQSPSNVANLSPETRTMTAKYAAALFNWFCCLPSVDMLAELPNFANIDLPFPITPDRKRVLIRREYGVRLADFWRQTKSHEKMAAHFKLQQGVALLTLLDYGFSNPSLEIGVLPLLQWQHIIKRDYHSIAKFVLENCDQRFWEEPEEFILDSLATPTIACICLYMLNVDCVRGRATEIPWATLDMDTKDMPAHEMEAFDEVLLEATKEMRANHPLTKECEALEAKLALLQSNVVATHAEGLKIRNQMKVDKQVLDELSFKYAAMNDEKKRHIQQIRPANFEDHGAELAQADDDIIISEVRGKPNFTRNHLTHADVQLEKGAKVLARRKLDASEKFEPAIFREFEAEVSTLALVCFNSEPGKVVSLPLTSIAFAAPLKGRMPVMSEGIRVAARVRHPMYADGIYSGTIISKYDVSSQEYAVIFDDFFDEYAKIDDMHLMVEQSWDKQTGKFEKRYSYMLLTSNAAAPKLSEERQVFLLSFFSKYPEWTMMKMTEEQLGKNMSCQHRDGRQWVAKALAIDRLMVWLRFHPIASGFDTNKDCAAFPCKLHVHDDEKMYRGNPRLTSARTQTSFERALETYREVKKDETATLQELHARIAKELTMTTQTRQQQRRAQRLQKVAGVGFEAAVPVPKEALKKQQGSGQFTQTARKCGTGLQVEPAVSGVDPARRRKEAQAHVLYRVPEPLEYSVEEYHETCSHDCIKDKDADPFDARFTKDHISPYYIPIMCGWRRVLQKQYYATSGRKGTIGCLVYYRAPCGRPLYVMDDISKYLVLTRSELNVDNFHFSKDLDETAYIELSKKHLLSDDLTNGQETRPIPVVNEIDREPDMHEFKTFNYRSRRYPLNKNIVMSTMVKEFCSGCDCIDDCSDWTKCACQRLTHRESLRAAHTYPDTTKGYHNRLLPERVPTAIYECNENCGCSRKRCANRVVQNEINVPMQLYKTVGMGWGVRAQCDIPKGAFISCYQGAILSDMIGEINGEGDEYYADLDFYNLAENDKQNSGIDCTADVGVFFDDVGNRDLTAEEVADAEPENELERFRRQWEDKVRGHKARREQRKQVKQQRKEQKKRGRKPKLVAKQEMDSSAAGTEGEEEEAVERAADAAAAAVAAGGGDAEKAATADEGMEEGDVQPREREEVDDDVDEGVEDGDSSESHDEDEEGEEKSASPDQERKRDEAEEERRRKRDEKREQAEREERQKTEMVRRKEKAIREREEAAKRYSLPLKDDTGKYQLDAYFENNAADTLFLIDAKGAGNIGRQYNHSCDPNMFTQHIFVDTHDIRLPWVAFFAKRAIKAGEEMTWDYGWNPMEGYERDLQCLCGAANCRGQLL